jgi:Fe-S-cluster-containing dehydrogenase component
VSELTRYGMLIDLTRCVGCNACTVSCKASNSTPDHVYFTHVDKIESGTFPNTQDIFIPRLCMQCKNAPCVTVCPTGATYKRSDGIVVMDESKCIGCKYCIAACPYGARTYIGNIQSYFGNTSSNIFEETGYAQYRNETIAKCQFCLQRIDEGYQPACVQTCPTVARFFGDLDDQNSEISKNIVSSKAVQLLPELGADPSVYYVVPSNAQLKISVSPEIMAPSLLNEARDLIKPLAAVAIGAVVVGSIASMAKSSKESEVKTIKSEEK